jgi:DHA3 family macrolide efflux protein-like MFS transporter
MNNLFESVANPARSSLLQTLVKPEELIKGNGYLSSSSSFGGLLGLAVAGVLIGVFGIFGAILVDALTFLISGLLILSVKYVHINNGKENQTIGQFFEMTKDGFKFLMNEKIILTLLICGAFINFLFVPYNVLQPVYVDEVLNLGVNGLTYLGVALMLGMALGGVIMGQIGDKVKPLHAIYVGLTMMGVTYFLLGFIDYISLSNLMIIILAIVFTTLFGFFLPVIQAPVSGVIMKRVPRDIIGRVMGSAAIFSLGAMPLGGALVSIIGDAITVPQLYATMGIFLVIVSSIFFLRNRNLVL